MLPPFVNKCWSRDRGEKTKVRFSVLKFTSRLWLHLWLSSLNGFEEISMVTTYSKSARWDVFVKVMLPFCSVVCQGGSLNLVYMSCLDTKPKQKRERVSDNTTEKPLLSTFLVRKICENNNSYAKDEVRLLWKSKIPFMGSNQALHFTLNQCYHSYK